MINFLSCITCFPEIKKNFFFLSYFYIYARSSTFSNNSIIFLMVKPVTSIAPIFFFFSFFLETFLLELAILWLPSGLIAVRFAEPLSSRDFFGCHPRIPIASLLGWIPFHRDQVILFLVYSSLWWNISFSGFLGKKYLRQILCYFLYTKMSLPSCLIDSLMLRNNFLLKLEGIILLTSGF